MPKADKKKNKTLEELTSAHRRSQAKCQLIQTSYIKRIELFKNKTQTAVINILNLHIMT